VGVVNLLLDNNGVVAQARVEGPPLAGTATGRCVELKFEEVTFPAFSGVPVRMKRAFVLH
jgi:hypothetical protein